MSDTLRFLQEEVERLRGELDLVGRGAAVQIQERTDQLNAALAEIERLRELCIDFMVPVDVVNGLRKAGRPFGWKGE
jgi:hypothetical protein